MLESMTVFVRFASVSSEMSPPQSWVRALNGAVTAPFRALSSLYIGLRARKRTGDDLESEMKPLAIDTGNQEPKEMHGRYPAEEDDGIRVRPMPGPMENDGIRVKPIPDPVDEGRPFGYVRVSSYR